MNLSDCMRKYKRKTPLTKAIIHTLVILCFGLITGTVIKMFDIYTTNLGNIFSQISVWIFICTIIAVYSSTAKRAAVNVFSFCSGMLFTYYITAEFTSSVYSLTFVYGWIIFDIFCPFMGFYVWYAKGKSIISTMISSSVVITTIISTFVLFDKLRISDILFVILTSFVLFKKHSPKNKKKARCLSERL